ncbi:MAG: CHAD domain-containing protein [Phycisphaerae bacterium]
MGFTLQPRRDLAAEIRRAAAERVDKAVGAIDNKPADEAVHEARKRLKQLRAIVRLIRGEIGKKAYGKENIFFRDAGRLIAAARDAAVLVETLDNLTAQHRDDLAGGAFQAVRKQLVKRRDAERKRALGQGAEDGTEALAEVRRRLLAARERIAGWPVKAEGFAAVAPGLKRVYARGREGLAEARQTPTTDALHDWRKRAKYLRYHVELLEEVWPGMMSALADQLHELTDYLGDDHDLAVLADTLTTEGKALAEAGTRDTLLALIERRREALQAAAMELGHRLYVETPADFVNRLGSYYNAAG